MKLHLPNFSHAKVLVVGDVMLDRYWYGGTSRISPEAPVPVVAVNQEEDRPGGAAFVALNMAALGASVHLIGRVGQDQAAATLDLALQAAGITTHWVVRADYPTTTKLRVISQQQQLIRVDFEQANDELAATVLEQKVLPLLSEINVLVLSDYAKGVLCHCQSLIQKAKAMGIHVLVDPKGQDFGKYQGASLLTPNRKEFEAVVGLCQTEAELVSRGNALIKSLHLDALLVTRSEQGMSLLRPDHDELHLPACAREVYDVTGAGDTVIGVIASALAAGSDWENSVGLANVAAGLACEKLGTASISEPELFQALGSLSDIETGVVSEEILENCIHHSRQKGEKIVFTNGCFDIIHAGHVGYLEQAKKQGDRLVVAINSDDSVRALKGNGRPINALDRRMAVLAALASVDWVVSFNSATPEPLLEKLKPDVLVKGGDYSEDEVVGAPIVKSYGGDVRCLSLLDNCSTTAIVERIQQDS